MTTDPTNPEAVDDPLLADLRRLAGVVDPVPTQVTAYARSALGWRRIDAELAELLVDSQLEAPATTRSSSDLSRTLTFRSSDLAVDIELQPNEEVALLGQLAPAGRAQVEAQRDDGSIVAATESDDLGRFRLELTAGDRIRLVVRRDPPAAPVETSWIDV
ncbi:MAG TPA: hypothetical protein VH538_03255 [Gaiellaceae bacterium]|jgi:hypothetical protein